MARSRKLRKRENRPRRKTNKRGKKALRAKTHKKTARRTRVKAHRPRRHARVTRRRVHRKKGGKANTQHLVHHGADLKTAYDGKSLTHHGKNIAHIKPMVDMSLGDLHGRTSGTTGSSTSGGPKIVKPGSVPTAGALETALEDIFGSSYKNPIEDTAKGVGVAVGAYGLKKFYDALTGASAKRQAALLKAFGQRENYASDLNYRPKQWIVRVNEDGKTVYKTFTNQEAANEAYLSGGNRAYKPEVLPEEITMNLKATGWDGPQGVGSEAKLTFIKNPKTGMLESTDPDQLAKTIQGMESIDAMTSGLDPKILASRGLDKSFKRALTFLKGVADGNVQAGESKDLSDLLERSGFSGDEAKGIQAILAGIDDSTQTAVASSNTLEGAIDKPFQATFSDTDSVAGDLVKGVEEGAD